MKIQKYLTVFLCSFFVLALSFWCFFIKTPDYSDAERRVLAKFPEITWQNIKTGKFSSDFETYATERFPLRDGWRSIKAYTRLNLFLQNENNNIFVKDGHISKTEYPLNHEMLDYAACLFTNVKEQYFKNNKTYLAIIPDKNKYIADLKLDYDELEKYMQNTLPFCTPIQIGKLLSADDYYFTDSHWKQENIIDIAKHIANSMGTDIPTDYKTNVLTTDFYGVYAGQSALKVKPDTINYLTNDNINNLEVTGASAVYDFKKANSKDPYEFFSSGNQPLVTIKNRGSTTDKKLIVFRDSFASSIMPLLAQGYSQVTMVDLRYINSSLLSQYVDFEDADILFLYSSSVLNNSTSMK